MSPTSSERVHNHCTQSECSAATACVTRLCRPSTVPLSSASCSMHLVHGGASLPPLIDNVCVRLSAAESVLDCMVLTIPTSHRLLTMPTINFSDTFYQTHIILYTTYCPNRPLTNTNLDPGATIDSYSVNRSLMTITSSVDFSTKTATRPNLPTFYVVSTIVFIQHLAMFFTYVFI